jgi:myo-inositol 2-dehydrogenase/D-chiro-inositol 1-dehydrogenase
LDRFAGAFTAEMDGFVGLVAGSAPNRAPASEARRSFAVAVAAERSRREQRTVRVDEVG